MASMDNDIVRRGYFNVLRNPRGGVLSSLMSSRRHWVVLRKQSETRPACLELYKNEDQATAPGRTINLDKKTFKNVRTNDAKKAFVLHLNDDVSMFQCASRADMEDWCRDIQLYGGDRPTDPTNSFIRPAVTNRDSDVFNGVPDDETYRVTLRQSNTIVFTGSCLLEILRDFDNNRFHIALFTEEELPRLIVKWQIDHVRQYGSNQAAFKFESGRKSSTGVDWFVLDTEPGAAARIHRAVDYWAKHIVEQVSNRDPRRSTLPGSSTPNQTSPVSPTPRPSSSLPRDSNPLSSSAPGIYQPLNAASRDKGGVYAAPGKVTDRNSSKNKQKKPAKSPAQAPNPAQHGGFYQPLQPLNSPYTNGDNGVYQDLAHETRSNDRAPPPRSPLNNNPTPTRDPTYMGLTPQTRTASEVYMGLDEARS